MYAKGGAGLRTPRPHRTRCKYETEAGRLRLQPFICYLPATICDADLKIETVGILCYKFGERLYDPRVILAAAVGIQLLQRRLNTQ